MSCPVCSIWHKTEDRIEWAGRTWRNGWYWLATIRQRQRRKRSEQKRKAWLADQKRLEDEFWSQISMDDVLAAQRRLDRERP